MHFGVRPPARRIARIYIAVIAASFVVCDAMLIFAPRVDATPRLLLVLIQTVVGGLLVAFMERRMVRASVTANSSGLRIYNGLATHAVAWPEVEGFEDSSRPFLMAVKRTHGRPIPMAGITPGLFGNRGPQQESMRELETYWQRMTAEHA